MPETIGRVGPVVFTFAEYYPPRKGTGVLMGQHESEDINRNYLASATREGARKYLWEMAERRIHWNATFY